MKRAERMIWCGFTIFCFSVFLIVFLIMSGNQATGGPLGIFGVCQHEEVRKVFAFQPKGSTAASVIHRYCDNCDNHLGYTLFRETPSDSSYLDVIREHSGGEVVGGEYYTITGIVVLADYDFIGTSIQCRIQNDNDKVSFSVEFRSEFEDAVKPLKKGDTVTFHGRFYDKGCGFTDCELLVNN